MLWLGSRHHSLLQNPSTSVLRAVLCCLGVVFLPILTCTFCLAIPPRCFQGVTSSRVPSLSTFSANMPEHKLRCWSTTRMRGLPYDRNQLFLYAFLRISPNWSRRGTTRCNPVPQHTTFMASNVCFSYVFKKNRSSPTTSFEHEGIA